jgi:hypothetical protein
MIIIKGIIKFFKLIKHKKKLYREILVFLILYNHEIVKIYNYYFIIDKNKTIFYRHLIYKFDFTELNNKEK